VFSGGGNGPYYGLRVKEDNPHSIFYLQAVLCHPLIEAMVKTGKTSVFQGGYYSHGKQFIDVLPFRSIDFNDTYEVSVHNQVVQLVKKLTSVTLEKKTATIPHKRRVLERNCVRIKQQIDNLINILYGVSNEEIQMVEELT